MTTDSRRVSELGITSTVSANDRVLVLTNPNTSANVQTITVRNLTTYLPIANSTVPGVIKIGPGLSVAANGTVTAPLPVASDTVTGVVKIGSGINVDANGMISVSGGGGTEGVYQLTYVTGTNNYVVQTTDVLVFVDPNSIDSDVTIVLPTGGVQNGQEFLIKNINPGAGHKVTVITDAGQTFGSNYIEDPVTGSNIISYDIINKGESHTWIYDGIVYKHLAELNPSPVFYSSVNSYHQIAIVNPSHSANASADVIAYNGLGDYNEGTGPFIDMGVNSSEYASEVYSIGGPNDGYLFTDTNGQPGGNLTIGAAASNTTIIFHTEGTTANTQRMSINSTSIGVNTVITQSNKDLLYINNPNNGIQIGGQWLVQMSATSNAESLWGSGNTMSYAWVYQDQNYSNGYAEFGTYVSKNSSEDNYAEMYVTSEPDRIFFIGHSDGTTYKRLTYNVNAVFNLPEGGDYQINGVSIVGTGQIDGGNAFTTPTAEITVDGGGA